MTAFNGSVQFSRRRFVRAFAGVIALAVTMRAKLARAEETLLVYRFDPSAIDPITGASCRSCAACRRHAAHKAFASFDAADARRAHPHCRCAIRSEAVTREQFVRLFRDPERESFNEMFDARWHGALIVPLIAPLGGLEMPANRVR